MGTSTLPDGWQMMPSVDEQGNTSWTPKQVTKDQPERIVILERARQERDEAEKLRAAGDVAGYQRMMAQAEETVSTVKTYGETFTGYSDQGTRIFSVTRGPQPAGGNSMGTPTVGFQTQAQKQTAKYANASKLIGSLTQTLRPEDIGAQGFLGEWVGDKTLAQLDPRFADDTRIDNRTALGWLRESLMREVNDDSKFSIADRNEISKILPSNGVFESYPDAMKRLNRAKQIIADRTRVNAELAGQPVPDFALSPQELGERFSKRKEAADKSLSDGLITSEQHSKIVSDAYSQTAESLKQYHGFSN
jgi:hypothetical protein